MATSLVLHSHFFNIYRISKLCLHHKGIITCFSVKGLAFRTFSSVGSLENHVSAPNNIHRIGADFEHSGKESDFERELQELVNEVKMLVMNGSKDDVVELLQANYEAVKERIDVGIRGIEEAATVDVVALGFMAIGDFKFVESLLDMLNEIVDGLKNDEPLLDSVLVHMGSMYSTLGKFEKSMLVYRRAIDNMESKYGKDNVFLVTPILGMAKVLSSIGRTTKAVDFYHRSISLLESSRGAETEDIVIPLFGLASLLLKQGKPKEAETPFLRILNIYKKLYGEDDGRVGMAMSSLAHVKCAMGKANEAIDLYKKALKVIKDSDYLSSDDAIVEKMRIDLAELLHAVGRGKEGRELLAECLLITETHKGKEDPSSVTHLINLAISYSRSKNYVDAERLLRMSLQVMEKTVASDDQSISFPMLHLAVTLYNLKRDEEAEQLALRALHIREKAFGKISLPVAEALDCLVSIQTRLSRDDDEALLEQLKRVLSIQEKEFGDESQEVLTTLKKVVFYLDKLGRKNDKLLLQKRLSSLRQKFKQRIQLQQQ